MKKLLIGSLAGYIVANLMTAYADGLFARGGNLLRNEVPEVDAQDMTQIMKYLLDGLKLSDSEVIERVHQMREAGYSAMQIQDHLGISDIAARLAVLARP